MPFPEAQPNSVASRPLPQQPKHSVWPKTDVAFQRYNLVTEDEMKGMKWFTEKADETRKIDTYMDTKEIL